MGYFIDSSKPVESRLCGPRPHRLGLHIELSTHAAILHLLTQARQWHGPYTSRWQQQKKPKKIVYTSRFVRVILAQGPC